MRHDPELFWLWTNLWHLPCEHLGQADEVGNVTGISAGFSSAVHFLASAATGSKICGGNSSSTFSFVLVLLVTFLGTALFFGDLRLVSFGL
ncbi:Pyridinium-3,5-bisthiocarboxylic acid mononucleotide nickel insertion protein [Frankliniella fusca]|uniref:Pyridinium-3,5-bisthiocarboxylic acid mononucleotide nickel insertion protein n=1 Tax=Frankliniella fusca TaxID=407009 RepID=A0AAE1HW49_9NEOP|nr:Pyridinium-3,5-bisthiocarboxylic acid mononucleotide nickel insertion protein [Frankliniella fusca]KAK3928984.1 Pyridinium-3,5-bisthiocarboxylic acid mononucleotide nickel insertion protein [Frankliniella fusca]